MPSTLFARAPEPPRPPPTTTASDRPLVSIGMPVFNGGPELLLAVRSIQAQTLDDWELLVMDDGSNDGKALALTALGDPRIRVLRDGRNKGVAARLNEAVDLARGRYFARMDHDDLSHPDRLRLQVQALEADPALDLVACRGVRMSEDGRLTGYLAYRATHEEICRHPWLRIPMLHPAWMGRVEWFRKHRYPEPAPYYAEDFELLLRAHRTSRYAALPQLLLAYRVRSRIHWRKNLRARLSQFRLTRDYFAQARRPAALVLAAGALLARLAFDGARIGAHFLRLHGGRGSGLAPHDAAEWGRVMRQIGSQEMPAGLPAADPAQRTACR